MANCVPVPATDADEASSSDPVCPGCLTVGVRWVRFPLEVIVVAVRWYLRFGLSYRDVEELLPKALLH